MEKPPLGDNAQEEAPVGALHTAARWYCISADPWLMPGSAAEAYENPNDDDQEEEVPENGSDEGGETHVDDIIKERWRANFWHSEFIFALLWEIERKTPYSFQSMADVRAFLAEAAGIAAETVWTRWNGPGYWVAWTKEWANDAENLRLLAVERERFEAYVTGVLSDGLSNVSPLPYRRTLSEGEVDVIWDGLRTRWPNPLLWFLGECEIRWVEGVHRFWWWRFAENVSLAALRAALREAGIRHVWKVPWDPPFEVDVETFVPEGEEAYFTSDGLDWVMYCDHESRITVAGDLTIRLLDQAWPDWERCRV